MWLTMGMVGYIYAFWALVALNVFVFGVSLYALAHVRSTTKALNDLDWETLANLTGEVGAMKRSLQKTNSRISGMPTSDPAPIL